MPVHWENFPRALISAPSLALLGPGLLGGSILYDAKRLGWKDVRVWARRLDAVEGVKKKELATMATTDLQACVAGVDLIVMASPVGTYTELAERIRVSKLSPNVIITDVGSVKLPVVENAGAIFGKAGIPFIGSHPMAGSEAKGLAAARENLFLNATCIITPEHDATREHVERIAEFWRMLGSQVVSMGAARHDEIVARISHMPHLAAVAVALAALGGEPGIAAYAAGGLRDTTRVASGDPAMWREILLENREAILASGRILHQKLGELLEFVDKKEDQALLECLKQAKTLRDSRYGPTQSS